VAPSRDDKLITHFVAYVHKNGHLYELDGRREFPINHGPTSAETLLKVSYEIKASRMTSSNSISVNADLL